MKRKDLQKLVFSKYGNDDGITKIFQDLNGAIHLLRIEWCCRRICEVSTIDLINPRGCSRTIRTKAVVQMMIKSTN